MTPAELEKAWREGLRGKEDAQDFDLSTAAEVQGFGDRNGFSRVHAGAVASEAQEWLGYDGLAGSKQQQKQQQSDAVDVVVATKPKLTPELDAKLQQLYKRNVDWRRRCEGVYAQQKHADDREQMKECTFVPRINAKSAKIVQVSDHSSGVLLLDFDTAAQVTVRVGVKLTVSHKKHTSYCAWGPESWTSLVH